MKRGSGAELCRCGIQLKGDMCPKCPPTSSHSANEKLLMRLCSVAQLRQPAFCGHLPHN